MRGEFIFSFHCVLVSLCSGSLAAYLWGMVGDVKIGAPLVLPKLHRILERKTLPFVPRRTHVLYVSRPCAVCLTPPFDALNCLVLFSYCRSQKIELSPHNDTTCCHRNLRAAKGKKRRILEATW